MHQIDKYDVASANGEAAIFISAKNTPHAITSIIDLAWSIEFGGLILSSEREKFLLCNAASSRDLTGVSSILIVLVSEQGKITFEKTLAVSPVKVL